MIRLLGSEVWKEIERFARASRRKLAAVAYVTSDTPVGFRKPDVLVVNASDGAIRYGQTSAKVLKKAFHSGTEIYSCPQLHAKIFLLDGVAVIGSANISSMSQDYLFEAAVLTDHPSVVSPAHAYFESLRRNSDPVDDNFIRHICAIKVERALFPHRGRRKALRCPISQHRTWLAAVWETEVDPDEKEFIKKGERVAKLKKAPKSSDVPWLRFTGDSLFRKLAASGDSVIQIWHPDEKQQRVSVYKAEPILYRQEEPGRTRFYIEEYSDADRQRLSWHTFKQVVRKAGLPAGIKEGALRSLKDAQAERLNALWPVRKRAKKA